MLLNKVDQISSLVQSSSDDVTKTSELLVASSDEIYNAMSEIEPFQGDIPCQIAI